MVEKIGIKPKGILLSDANVNYMSNRDKQAYDRGVVMFSPEGRIYQVEYARNAVENGNPTMGVEAEDGVVLAALTSSQSPLAKSAKKIYHVSRSIGVAATGYVPDGRRLVDDLRLGVQQEKYRYGEDPDVEAVAKQIADKVQESTQRGGTRPFGSSLVVGGVDETGASLWTVDPGGVPKEWLAVADGSGRDDFMNYLEHFQDELTDGVSVRRAKQIVLESFEEVTDGRVTEEGNLLNIGVVREEENPEFKVEKDADFETNRGE